MDKAQLYTIVSVLFSGNIFLILAFVKFYAKKKDEKDKEQNEKISKLEIELKKLITESVKTAKDSLKSSINNLKDSCKNCKERVEDDIKKNSEDIKELYSCYRKTSNYLTAIDERFKAFCEEINRKLQ